MRSSPLGAGLDYFDLLFRGTPDVIATGLLTGADGVALVDPGPSTTIPTLKAALASRGASLSDVRGILLTHIHLDHAGATGSLLAECPSAVVYVHEVGAPHLVDPSKLLASATRLYGADMEKLWGDVRPVPASRLQIVGDNKIRVVGHSIDVAKTPGHASHHVSYFLQDAGVAFVGDTAGLCRSSGKIVLPATPPPDVDLDAWRASTKRILAWHPDVLFLTHFGPHRSPSGHFSDFWTRIEDWSRRVQAQLQQPGDDAIRAKQFSDEVLSDLARATTKDEAQAYLKAGRFDFSWNGLARYWRKKSAAPIS
jgi:glyoxylase-like metal-dependent hydrolase (beta-lactamase superfamily II)